MQAVAVREREPNVSAALHAGIIGADTEKASSLTWSFCASAVRARVADLSAAWNELGHTRAFGFGEVDQGGSRRSSVQLETGEVDATLRDAYEVVAGVWPV